jgi:diguanylate cyclase
MLAVSPFRLGANRMQAACIPLDETGRLAALRRLNILDTVPSDTFDRVTRLAAALLDMPIAMVSLVDQERQWFKSRVGFEATETPRDISFCGHAVYLRQPLIGPNATDDERFADNPMVTGAPHIRAYLGVPLFTREGHAIGTLCTIDTHPRDFDAQDLGQLTDLAALLQQAIHAEELSNKGRDVLHYAEEREALFRDTFEQAAVGMSHTDLSGRLLRVNQRLCEMLGYDATELKNISFIDITHPDDVANNSAMLQKMIAGELDSYRLEKRYRRKDGTYFWSQLSVALKRARDGLPDYIIAAIEDIGEKKQAETDLLLLRDSLRSQVAEQTVRLRETNEALRVQVKKVLESERAIRDAGQRFRAIANNIPALIGYWNRDIRCEFANEVYREWFGVDPLKVVGMSMRELVGEAQFASLEPHVAVALDGHPQRFESRGTKDDGTEFFREVRYIPDVSGTGVINGFYVMATDNSQSRLTQRALETANSQLKSDSVTDYLTGLSNRRVFSERSEEACKRFQKYRESYGLILLDLDNFKQINDGYGHDAGDETLRAVGRLLKGQLRSHRDIAARLGGEEFAILLFGDLDEDLLRLVAERVRAQIGHETVRVGSRTFQFTASFGLAISHVIDSNWKTIYARADAALYVAKAAGKNCVEFNHATEFSATGRFRTLRAARS